MKIYLRNLYHEFRIRHRNRSVTENAYMQFRNDSLRFSEERWTHGATNRLSCMR